MKIKEGFALRNIAGSDIVVPVGKACDEFNGMITLNESGAFFWKCFEKETTIDEAVQKILSEYDAEEERVRADIESFVATLKQNNLIEE
ncbi:MAG: PqqD family protein [Eubacterium sp.]